MSEESLFREVDEEVRQDQFKKIWARYGNLIIAACLVLIAVVAGIKGWQYWQIRQSEQAAEIYSKVVADIEAGKTSDAVPLAESIGHQGFGILARMAEAAALGAVLGMRRQRPAAPASQSDGYKRNGSSIGRKRVTETVTVRYTKRPGEVEVKRRVERKQKGPLPGGSEPLESFYGSINVFENQPSHLLLYSRTRRASWKQGRAAGG